MKIFGAHTILDEHRKRYIMEYSIRFSRKDPTHFFKTLRQRVNSYFVENQIEKTGNFKMYLKTTVILLLYFGTYAMLLGGVFAGWTALLAYTILGLTTAGIGLCIMHDANHGAFSKYPIVNKIMSYTMNLVGASNFTWNIQHNVLHHSYTNVYHLDEDIDDKPFLRLSPHGKLKKYHRFQHVYAFLLYCLATLSWVLSKDFRQLYHYNKTGVTSKSGFSPTKETIEMIISKALYLTYIIVLPILFGVQWGIVLIGFVISHAIAGFIITVVFQLAHVVEGPEHFEAEENGVSENTWAIHQIRTTANFSTKNKFITWCVGGLNFQIEHHLFPSICHIHYPEVSKIVKSTIKEFDLPYHEYDRLMGAISSHVKMLKSFGHGEKLKMTA
jgi:linoleoyl-CoA desaturase